MLIQLLLLFQQHQQLLRLKGLLCKNLMGQQLKQQQQFLLRSQKIKLEAEEQAELERIQKERAAQKEASRATIYEEMDNIQAMLEVDELLAARVQAEEQEL
ncbi:hypothetical protein Tco_0474954 [Tanacetum coccineum]